VRAAFEPFFRALFEKVSQVQESKIVFVYHCWRLWMLDVLREYFPTSKVVEVRVTRSLLLDRFVDREVKAGKDHEALWRDDPGERFAMLRDKYGPEYKGNEDNYKKFIEWRFYFPVESISEGHNVYVVDNDNFEGAQQLSCPGIRNVPNTEARMMRRARKKGIQNATWCSGTPHGVLDETWNVHRLRPRS
jgi:hypothetical protein